MIDFEMEERGQKVSVEGVLGHSVVVDAFFTMPSIFQHCEVVHK